MRNEVLAAGSAGWGGVVVCAVAESAKNALARTDICAMRFNGMVQAPFVRFRYIRLTFVPLQQRSKLH